MKILTVLVALQEIYRQYFILKLKSDQFKSMSTFVTKYQPYLDVSNINQYYQKRDQYINSQ